jgi:hypothetical protein
VDTKDEARRILPPVLRADAKIVQLNAFTSEDLEKLLKQHGS